MRGGAGVLLTTSARAAQGSGVASTQMDAAEAVRSLQAAQALGKALGDVASKQQAMTSADAAKAQQALLSRIDPKDKGKHDGAVNGHAASKAASGTRELDAAQPVEKFAEPVVLMDAPANINWATPASTVLFAGEQLHWSAQGDLHMTAAHTVSTVAANAAGQFSHAGGIQAIAANGPVSLQAHTGQLEILADKSIKIISVNDSIEIKASQKIVLQAGQSSITLEGGDITFACPGNFTVKGGQHVFDGGGSTPAQIAVLPDGESKLNNFIALNYRDPYGQPMAGVAYKILFANGTIITGRLDEKGNARHDNVPEQPISAQYETRTPDPEKPWNPLAQMLTRVQEKFSA